MEYINEYAKDFFFEGGQEACLLIHGFTASPAQMRYLGKFLYREGGYTVRGSRLPGHGTSVDDMQDSNWEDWWNAVREEYESLDEKYDKVYVMGLSMGGILSLLLAEEYQVDKVISIAAPIKIYNKLAYLAPVLKFIKRFNHSLPQGQAAKEKRANKDKYDVGYLATPLSTIPSLLKLIKMARKNLPKIDIPALIIQSKDDRTVVPKSAQIIYDEVSSDYKNLIWLENSRHLVTLGPEKDILHKKILDFLEG
ncbi:alpha/beta hydrolase [Halonatronum saccharophilum]|uniref:alpha/beta hydrolase n=1 Tax=Halonatronum saccharophilum TaxID=150060 RepID=UPI0004815D02|nr:alpha/beta fold hydrolase [Halonatronum saccharophilum]